MWTSFLCALTTILCMKNRPETFTPPPDRLLFLSPSPFLCHHPSIIVTYISVSSTTTTFWRIHDAGRCTQSMRCCATLSFIIVLGSTMWRAQCGASIFKQQQMRLLRGQCMFRRKAHVMLPLASNFCTTTASSHHPTIRGGGVPSSPRRHLASSLLFRSIHSSPSSSSSSSRPPPSSPSSLESTAPSSAPLQADTETETDKISSTPQEIFRVDYRPPSFSIEHVHLSFMLDLDDTVVTTRSSISRSSSSADSTGHQPLVLDGKREKGEEEEGDSEGEVEGNERKGSMLLFLTKQSRLLLVCFCLSVTHLSEYCCCPYVATGS